MPESVFIIDLKDLVSPGLKRMEAVGRETFGAVENGIRSTEATFSRLEKSIGGVNERMGMLKESAALFAGELVERGVERSFDFLKEQVTDVFKGGMEAGMTKMEFNVLDGEEAGKELYEGIHKYIGDSMFGTELFGVGKEMLAMGVNTEEVMPVMEEMGDISMGNSEKMEDLAHAFGLVAQTGHLTAREVMMMTHDGFNPLHEISRTTGVSVEKLDKIMAHHGITIGMVKHAFQTATSEGGIFNNMMAKVMETPGGKWKQMTTNIGMAKEEFGLAMLPVLSKIIDDFKPEIDALPETLESWRPTLEAIMNDFSLLVRNADKLLLVGKEIGIAFLTWKGYSMALKAESLLLGDAMTSEANGVRKVNEALTEQTEAIDALSLSYDKLTANGVLPQTEMAEMQGMKAFDLPINKAGVMGEMGTNAIKSEAGLMGLVSNGALMVGIAWMASDLFEYLTKPVDIEALHMEVERKQEEYAKNDIANLKSDKEKEADWRAFIKEGVIPMFGKGPDEHVTGIPRRNNGKRNGHKENADAELLKNTAEGITGGGARTIHISFKNVVEHFTIDNKGADIAMTKQKADDWLIETMNKFFKSVPTQ